MVYGHTEEQSSIGWSMTLQHCMQKPGGIIALLDEAWYGLWYFERFVYKKKKWRRALRNM